MMIKKLSFCGFVLSIILLGCAEQAIKDDTQVKTVLPAATELSFRDFYKSPVGPMGLEPTQKLLSLKGKRVRLKGYMVVEEEPTPGLFMLSSVPVNIPEKEDGPSDDLPGATAFVHMPKEDANKVLAHRTGLWDLEGTLELGGKEEANGRISYVRLLIDDDLAIAPEKINGN